MTAADARRKRVAIGSIGTTVALETVIILGFGPFSSLTAIIIGCSAYAVSRLAWEVLS